MVYQTLDESERSLLRQMIGKNFERIKYPTQVIEGDRLFGNILLMAGGACFEILNEVEKTPYFGMEEDVSRFHVKKLVDEKDYSPSIIFDSAPSQVTERIIDGKIEDILVVEDEVNVFDSGKIFYSITIDTAIVFRMGKTSISISRDWSLGEEMSIRESNDYENAIYSVKQMIDEWSDEDADDPKSDLRPATCDRKFISLKDGGEIAH
jgi:hypothetical protein